MSEETRRSLLQILQKVDGLLGIILSDRDGVTMIKAHLEPTSASLGNSTGSQYQQQGNGTGFPESALRLNFLSTFSTATEQASKLGMGRNNTIISIYQKYQMVQFNKLPVVVTLIAKKDANTGYLLTVVDELLSPLVGSVRKEVTAYYNNHLLNTGDVL